MLVAVDARRLVHASLLALQTMHVVDMSISAALACHTPARRLSYEVKSLVERCRLHTTQIRVQPTAHTIECHEQSPVRVLLVVAS